MDDTAQVMLRQARAASSVSSGTVRVSAPPALTTYCIAPHAGELRQANPELKLILQASSSIAALDRGEADIALRLSRPQEKGAVARKIGVLRFGVYATASYAARPAETWEFIAFDEPLDHVPQQAWLRRLLAGRAISLEASDLFGQLAAAKAGAGVAVLPRIMGDQEPLLTPLDVTPAPPDRDLWLITYPDLRRSLAVREVMTFLANCIKRTLS